MLIGSRIFLSKEEYMEEENKNYKDKDSSDEVNGEIEGSFDQDRKSVV